MGLLKKIGPGTIVTAAFIGPGTLVTCSVAGIHYGYGLLWALVLGIAVTILLLEISTRLTIINRQNLGAAILANFKNPLLTRVIQMLIIGAIFIGNAAYQSGNLSGAVIGLQSFFPEVPSKVLFVMVALTASALLWLGSYHVLEKLFTFLVFLMGVVFIMLLFVLPVDFGGVLRGLNFLSTPSGSFFTIVGLIGTTVVPYNLFLHSNAILNKWGDSLNAGTIRSDLVISVMVGGLISGSILIGFASIAADGIQVSKLPDLTERLSMQLGPWSLYFVGLGIFIAGLTSSLTAPLAAAFAITGVFRKAVDTQSFGFRSIWILVICSGLFVGLTGVQPIFIIQFAQFANGILLPVMAILMLLALRKTPEVWIKLAGMAVVIVTVLLAYKSIVNVLSQW